jgi:hypothetical protein
VTRKSWVLSAFSGEVTREIGDLACSTLGDLRWLDEDREWFWLSTGRNTLLSRLGKVLAVATRLPIELAHAAVMRDRRMSDTKLPLEVFVNFCTTLDWCRVADGWVFVEGAAPELDELESTESILVDILRAHGPSLKTTDLRQLAMLKGVGDVSFYRTLSDSNVIVRHASDVYGLVGSDGTLSNSRPPAAPSPQLLPELRVPEPDEPDSKDILSGCGADSPTFPMDVLARVVLRSAQFRQKGELWSLFELRWTRFDQDVLRQWAQCGEIDLRKLGRESVKSGSLRFDGAEAVAMVFLATCCLITRAEGLEGEMWPSIQAALGQRLRSKLFHGPGVPRIQIREASERICFKLGIRHVFGREGEQSWFRTVFLQIGMTRSGWQRLPWWLSQSSILPVAIEDLLHSVTLRSQSFAEFWRTLQRYRSEQLPLQKAKTILIGNPWVAQAEIETVLTAALERRDVQRMSGQEDCGDDQADRLFDPPLLRWSGDAPRFELSLRPRSRWLTEPRYVLVLNGVRHVPITRQSDEYRFESPCGVLEIDLTSEVATLDLRRRQVSCMAEPLSLVLHPESSDFAFYDLSNGERLAYGDETLKPNHGYALLSKSTLTINEEALEMRRVFGGDWIIRAFRNGVPKSLEIRRDGALIWNAPEDPRDSGPARQLPRARVSCGGGRWGEKVSLTIQAPSEFLPTHLILDGERTPLKCTTAGVYGGTMTLSPEVDYDRVRTRVECLWKGRLRWLNGDLVMGRIQGIAIESEVGWKILRENKDMDSEYLHTRRIWARLPLRYEGDDVLAADWAWMEGAHFCGRPRTAATAIGSTVYAIGEPLRLSLGPYNRSPRGLTTARSVIQSGVIARSEKAEGEWRLQLRRTFELGPDHTIWIWKSGDTRPERLDSTQWRQEENVCNIHTGPEIEPVALAIAFQGVWLGARTCEMGWMGFAEVIRASRDWLTTASWLRWWRVPLLHEALRSAAEAAVRADPIRTIRAWVSPAGPSAEVEHADEFDDAWLSLIRAFLWDWQPNRSESGALLTELNLLTGDIERDLEHAWDGCEDILSIHPLLLVQAAARGVGAIYPTSDTDDQRFLLEKLRNRLLDIDRFASQSEIRQALKESQKRAADAMAVDELFVSKSLLPDATALIKGELENDHNLRVAIANSQTVPNYLAAAILEKIISGEFSEHFTR